MSRIAVRETSSLPRKTRQRRAIRQAFEKAGRPLGPQEVLHEAKSNVPALGIATVYRNVKAMVEEGALEVVELPGAPNRYELAGKDHHHHFLCRECDRVYEVEDCLERISELAPSGFRLETHEIFLYGLCGACSIH